MHKDLSRKPDLLIVSDTPMWENNGSSLAFEPVIREIENFYTLFNKITWIGFKYNYEKIHDSAVGLENAEVNFIMLDNIGGAGLFNNLKILWKLPGYFIRVLREVGKYDVVHARGPSIPAFFVLFIAKWVKKPVYWYKYAGNWDLADPPKSYKMQKDNLKNNQAVIGTINGKWANQPKHILSFENPCFTKMELEKAHEIARLKKFDGPLNLVFVGRIEILKGFDRLVAALAKFTGESNIGHAYFVGGGVNKKVFEAGAKLHLKIPYSFTGSLNRIALNEIYARSHIFCLPSLSEGFPKVLAESAAFGCVPVVSDLSCIGQYIMHKENGMLLNTISVEEIYGHIKYLLDERKKLTEMSYAVNRITDKFTYEYYNERIRDEILSNVP